MTRYTNLVDIRVDYDESELEAKLSEIEEKLEALGSGKLTVADIDARFEGIDEKLEALEGSLDDKVSEDSVTQAVDDYLDDKLQDRVDTAIDSYGLMSHDAVQDTVEEWVKDNGYVDSDDVEQAIEDKLGELGLPDKDDVQQMIDDSLPDGVDEDRVQELIDQAIQAADNTDVKDLERRLDLYAQRVDQLRGEVQALREQSEKAITFFGLVRQAFDLLRQEVGR